ncbi:MAG: ABC transporter ATP-binding protein [Candidatus Lambdaproteobacteria bacterium]|nr:ABC transporter ATP-binding protein [Candidatus Lambdaproteobacteria bacterium]
MLLVRNLHVSYRTAEAVHGIDLRVRAGEAVAVVGSNGAGKSSTLRGIMGLASALADEISFQGGDLRRMPTYRIARLGLGFVPEGRELFPGLNVAEELLLGGRLLRGPQRRQKLDEVFALFPRLAERRKQICRTLSGGEQQMLALGRVLMSSPRLLLLDEPSLGLSPLLQDAVFGALRHLRDGGLAMLLVEQNVHRALALCERAYVLELGLITRAGPSGDVRADPQVQKAYLGG